MPGCSVGSGGGVNAAQRSINLHFTVDGTYMGQTVNGPVVPGTLQCSPLNNGGLEVIWGGTVAGTGQISGDLNFAQARMDTFGSNSQGNGGGASVVIKGDYHNRYAASAALGTGSASLNPDNSGSIDAHMNGDPVGSLHLQGTWSC